MKKSARLSVVHRIAALRESQAARELGGFQSEVQKARQQLAQLEDYHQDYRQRWQAMGKQGVTGKELRRFAGFMRDLGHAIDIQQQQVVFVEQQFNKALLTWKASYAKCNAMGELVDRVRTEEDIVREKRLDKEINDQSARRFRGIYPSDQERY